MKVRCIDERGISDSLTLNKEYEVFEEGNTYYRLKVNDRGRTYHYYAKHRFEEVKEENKMEKTFREVIADIKEGEVWENEFKSIKLERGTTIIENLKGGSNIFAFDDSIKYKLKRKQYTFEEAFKAYEEGKVIECVVTGDKYTWNGLTDLICKKGKGGYCKLKSIYIEEIRGKWYIND